MLNAIQTSDDCLNNPFRLIGISDLDTHDACLSRRIVVPAGKQGIPYKNHLIDCNAQDVPEFSNTVGLVNARFGDIDRRRATQMDRKLRNKGVKDCLDLLPLGKIRVPSLLFF
jgi:hypothetical protein